jgi:hypothetical protein
MGEAAPVTLHRLLQPTGVSAPVTQLLHPTPTPHPHAGGRGEDEAHRGRVRTPGITGVGREDGEKAASTSLNTPRLPQAPSPQLRAGYAFGNAAPVPAGNGPFDYYPPKLCCSNQPCFKLKSWEAGNDGRRYYRCFYAGVSSCF